MTNSVSSTPDRKYHIAAFFSGVGGITNRLGQSSVC